jgi:ABC-2 type transport system permease protein
VTAPRARAEGTEFPRELLLNLTLRELRGKYKRSVIGWGWSVVNPVVIIAVYSVVFSIFLRVEPPVGDPSGLHTYALFLMCALLPWLFTFNGAMGSVTTLIANESLIKKVYFPRWVLPASSVASWLVSFCIELGVMAVVLLIAGNMALPWLPVVLGVVALHTMFVLGVGLVLAPLNAYFRDVEHFTAIGLNIWFWATPVIYPLDVLYKADGTSHELLGVPVTRLMNLNPMYHFVTAYRDLLYHLRAPEAMTWVYMAVAAVASLTIGRWVFSRLEGRLAEEL